MNRDERKRLEGARDLLDQILATPKSPYEFNLDRVSLARALCAGGAECDRDLPTFPGMSQAWRILVALYVEQADGRKVAVSDVAFLSGMPMTTNLRIQNLLVERGLAIREPDPEDRRRVWFSLTEDGFVRTDKALASFASLLIDSADLRSARK